MGQTSACVRQRDVGSAETKEELRRHPELENVRGRESRSHRGTAIHIAVESGTRRNGKWKRRYILNRSMDTAGKKGVSSKPVDRRAPVLHF